jgi:hypothetical protein
MRKISLDTVLDRNSIPSCAVKETSPVGARKKFRADSPYTSQFGLFAPAVERYSDRD